jgi:hypothetical protein
MDLREHVHSIVVKIGIERAQFDVDGILENLSSTNQVDLANLLLSKYLPWMATDIESENRRLNQILLTLTSYLARQAQRGIPTLPVAVPPMGASVVTACGSGTQASNNRSTTRPLGRTSPRVRSHIDSK